MPQSFAELIAKAYAIEIESRDSGHTFGIMPMDTGGYDAWVSRTNWFEVSVAGDNFEGRPRVWSLRMTPGLPPSRWPVARCGFVFDDSTAPILCSSLAELPVIYAVLFESSTDYYQEVRDFHEAFGEDHEPLADLLSVVASFNVNDVYHIPVDGSSETIGLLNTILTLCSQFELLKGSINFWQSLASLNAGLRQLPNSRTETHWPEFLNLTCYRLYVNQLPNSEKIQLLSQMLLFDAPRYQGGLAEFGLSFLPGMSGETNEQLYDELTAELRNLRPNIPSSHPYSEYLHLICSINAFASYDGSLHLHIARELMQAQQYAQAFGCLQVATYWAYQGQREDGAPFPEIELALELVQRASWRDIHDAIRFNLKYAAML